MRKGMSELTMILALGLSTTFSVAQETDAAAALTTTDQAFYAALLPLPLDMRPGAGIIRWSDEGTYEQVRKSTNGFSCGLDNPSDEVFDVRCYADTMLRVIARWRALRNQHDTFEDANEQFQREIDEGSLTFPMGPTAGYRMLGPISALALETGIVGPEIEEWQSIHFPFRTSEELGLTEQEETRQGDLMPFVMASGTWWSHVMIMHGQ